MRVPTPPYEIRPVGILRGGYLLLVRGQPVGTYRSEAAALRAYQLIERRHPAPQHHDGRDQRRGQTVTRYGSRPASPVDPAAVVRRAHRAVAELDARDAQQRAARAQRVIRWTAGDHAAAQAQAAIERAEADAL